VIEWGDGHLCAEAAAEHYFTNRHQPSAQMKLLFSFGDDSQSGAPFSSAGQSSPRRPAAKNYPARHAFIRLP